ncbi:MAG: 3-isopropylmalate dehydratase [Candidatus Thorarchaeota archaeon]
MEVSGSSIVGRAWVLGDNIDTDQIISGQYLTMLDYAEMARHALEIPRPDFARSVRKGDVIVAGRNLGGGSSREEAPRVLKELGVACIVAESFARLFYRNSFNIGLPLLIVPSVSRSVEDGATVEVNLERGTLHVMGTSIVLQGKSLPEFILKMLRAGGAVQLYLASHVQ